MKKFLIFLLFLVFVYASSVAVRYHQHVLLTSKDTILTTHDGYRWLRYAEYVRDDVYYKGDDKLGGVVEPAQMLPKPPLLSVMLSNFDDMKTGGSLLTVFLSGLFIFPLGLFFYYAGFPAGGVGASVIGVLSFAYLSRTSAYQIDTDMLNLFFVSFASLAVFMAGRGRAFLWAFLAGLSMYLFWRWYFHSGYSLICFTLLIFALRKKDFKIIVCAVVIYILASSPFVVFDGVRDVLHFTTGQKAGAGVTADVAEMAVVSIRESFGRIFSVWWLVPVGLACSFLLGRHAVYLAVFYILGTMLLFKGVRFDMYLAPLCGAGFGVLADRFMKGRLQIFGWAVILAFTMLFGVKPYLTVMPEAVVERAEYDLIRKLAGVEKDAVIASVWDKGFLIEYLTGRRVFSDGASQFKAGNGIYAKAMLDMDAEKSAEAMLSASGGAHIYVLLTPDMRSKLSGLIKSAGCYALVPDGQIVLKCTDAIGAGNHVPLEKTLYFKMHVIGAVDINCFDKLYTDSNGFALFKVSEKCRKNQM